MELEDAKEWLPDLSKPLSKMRAAIDKSLKIINFLDAGGRDMDGPVKNTDGRAEDAFASVDRRHLHPGACMEENPRAALSRQTGRSPAQDRA